MENDINSDFIKMDDASLETMVAEESEDSLDVSTGMIIFSKIMFNNIASKGSKEAIHYYVASNTEPI